MIAHHYYSLFYTSPHDHSLIKINKKRVKRCKQSETKSSAFLAQNQPWDLFSEFFRLGGDFLLEFQGGGGAFVLDPVIGHFQELFDLRNVRLGGVVAVGFDHAFKDVFFRGFRQMNHVVIIKTVIPQLVHHDFVAWEVIDACGNLLQGLFYAE